jgi:tetratricopeptide (TPR) repeat protein
MKTASPKLVFALLMALAYTLGTMTHLRAVGRTDGSQPDEGAFKKLLGDGRRLFAGQFVEMADVYFHSGRYPSIFDRAATAKSPKAITSAVGEAPEIDEHADHEHAANGNCIHNESHEGHKHDEHGNCEHDDSEDEHVKAMTPPTSQNWLESFIRRFRITEHTHLAQGNEREIMPWLKIAIELDPQAVDTYTTAAYWLRTKLDRAEQAEKVLREGIRNNPTNFELLYEMGRLYKDNQHNLDRARNIWRYALKCWQEQSDEAQETSRVFCSRIASSLGELEKETGNLPQAIKYFELAKLYSPQPEGPQRQIDELRAKLATP